ncbi:4-aminobutyrate aminotransferase [Sinobacterium caligoides]|uniref:4-aminobutyrate aminotransferase n=1 Tax=Sinobacterium caligoides TaxID=933926 RepID=A0A3N2E020_9GAMM|nr:aspartate aminotransferase family protein [Sinobacterium caligoides]ROS05428.1 4-aminobutyrate aminotransferase [Sinobacterium caligoides]
MSLNPGSARPPAGSTNSKPLVAEGDINNTAARQQWREQINDAGSQQLLDDDAGVFLHQSMSSPCMNSLSGADGIYLTDGAGNRTMDFHGNNVHQLGHGHPNVIKAIEQQMQALPFSPRRFTNQTAVDCAKKIIDICPDELTRLLFAPGGTSAVGMALKLARLVTGNAKVISLWDGFHGASLDAIAVGGEAGFRQGLGPLMAGVERIPPSCRYRGPFVREDGDDLHYADYLEYVIEKEGGVGAFIAETVRNTDVQVPSKAYWQRIREICDKHGVMLIIDEIPNGMGRSGHWFTFEEFGICPDILCIGKGLGGGIMPLAAMITREQYNIAGNVSLGHYTHEKSPVSCAAALATIETIEQQQLLSKVKDDEQWMRQRLAEMQERYPIIGDVRGIGLLWGIELVLDRDSKEKASAEAERVMYQCMKNGVSFKVSAGNVLQLSPPLIIERTQLAEAIDIVEQAIASVCPPQQQTLTL